MDQVQSHSRRKTKHLKQHNYYDHNDGEQPKNFSNRAANKNYTSSSSPHSSKTSSANSSSNTTPSQLNYNNLNNSNSNEACMVDQANNDEHQRQSISPIDDQQFSYVTTASINLVNSGKNLVVSPSVQNQSRRTAQKSQSEQPAPKYITTIVTSSPQQLLSPLSFNPNNADLSSRSSQKSYSKNNLF
jgi:hypothetical protein